ncbi:Dabb family protein [Sphingobacterium sp. HJSM2_6]|uniref:Dabb family protein n=1 Tax=Sphingobacterium sp. HJSM2_6 TaxID=3366264 RepID=UPI003BEC4A19
MKRKNFIASILVGTASGSLLASCADGKKEEEKTSSESKTGFIVHNVYFWLKEGITAEEEQEFLKFIEILKKIPGIYEYEIGKPSPTTPRPVVDNSFSYYCMATFKNMEDIETYEKHPDHIAAAEAYSKYWTKVEVKDATLL